MGVLVTDDDDDVGDEDGCADDGVGDGTTGGATNLTLARVGEFLWIGLTVRITKAKINISFFSLFFRAPSLR